MSPKKYRFNHHHESVNPMYKLDHFETGGPRKEQTGVVEPFCAALETHNLTLVRDKTTTLQINVGLLCNQSCSHCHLNAGPGRKELMAPETMDQVVETAKRGWFETIDITGGAPEMHPAIGDFISRLAPFANRLILRANLTALAQKNGHLMNLLKDLKVVVVASFPSLNADQAESLRGEGSFNTSIETLKRLNDLEYGIPGSGLELDLVYNPAGAFLPPSQDGLEKRFHKALNQKYGIRFNHLYTFANVPLGRFRAWLKRSGNLESYLQKLACAFNACAVDGLMCRTMVSISWDGYLFDCDFHQAVDLYLGERKTHISELRSPPQPGTPIAVDNHCYTCTAGSGFT